MENNYRHGDIFYVVNGHWYGVYVNYNNQPYVYIYDPSDVDKTLEHKRLEILKEYRNIIQVGEDYFEDVVSTYQGNIFDMSKNNINKLKKDYEEALYVQNNIDNYFKGGIQ